jgi:6-phosphogluconolactonase (cycloisomerase 2 family)
MKHLRKAFQAMGVIAAGVVLWAPSPGASSEHFVVSNDNLIQGNNTGTVWTLENFGPVKLAPTASLMTGGTNIGIGALGMNETAIIQHGSDVCIFISDNERGDIASFLFPGYTDVGRFKLPGIVNSNPGLGLAARKDFLFANYVDNSNGIAYIATWRIETGCTLNLANTYLPPGQVVGMAISPNGNTLVVSYGAPQATVDSFSVGLDGSLTEHGPYDYYYLYLNANGVEITADSKYALIAEGGYGTPQLTEVGIYPINPDGSLGADIDSQGLGRGTAASWIRLSPDEKFLFVSGASSKFAVTTLTFDERAPSLSYSCIAKMPTAPKGITTVMPSGSGGYLTVTEGGSPPGGAVGLFTIEPRKGCLTQVPGSPYGLGSNSIVSSVASWPPRPF